MSCSERAADSRVKPKGEIMPREAKVTKEKAGHRNRKPRWRDAWGPDQTIQRVRPAESRECLRNPHKGTETFQRFNGDPLYPLSCTWKKFGYLADDRAPVEFKPPTGRLRVGHYPDTTVSYCRWPWWVIEPEEGKRRWDILDGALDAARVRGQTLHVRMQPYTMNTPPPGWLWKLGTRRSGPPRIPWLTWAKEWEPDVNGPHYRKYWGDFIRAFGRRYDGHPDLELVDVAVGGPWAENGGANTTRKTFEELIGLHIRCFKKTLLVVNECGDHDGPNQFEIGIRKGLGWRCDGFGEVGIGGDGLLFDGVNEPAHLSWRHMYDCYPRAVHMAKAQDAWKNGPVVMETGWWHLWDQYRAGVDIDWVIEQGYMYHTTLFMPKSTPVPEAWMEKIEEFNRRMGYRFVLRQLELPLEAKPGSRIGFSMWIDNVGVAPIYRPYRLAFRFRQGKREATIYSKADIREWMPDHSWVEEEITLPKTLERGEVKIDVGILDEATGKPRVKFAIKEVLPDGWHPMTSMDVV